MFSQMTGRVRHRVGALVLLAGLGSLGLAARAVARTRSVADAQLPSKVGSVALEMRGGVPLVRVLINGVAALLILDTGSGALVLDSAAAERFRISTASGTRGRANGSATTAVRIGRAERVEIGGARVVDPVVAVMDLSAVKSRVGFDVHGAIGYELFDQFVVDVSFDTKTVVLHDPQRYVYRGPGQVVPLEVIGRVPLAKASLTTRRHGLIDGRFLLDLGSSGLALKLNSRFVRAHGLEDDTIGVMAPIANSVSGPVTGAMMRMPSLQLASLTVRRPSTGLSRAVEGSLSPSKTEDGLIGTAILRHAHLVVDYARSRLIIEPTATFGEPDVVDASGVILVQDTDTSSVLRVLSAIRGSAAEEAGIQANDEIVSVDRVAVTTLRMHGVREMLQAHGVRRVLSVRRGKSTVSIPIRLRRLI